MKFLLRLLHVFIGVLIFLGLGYLIQNIDLDYFITAPVEETVSDTADDSISHDEMADDATSSESEEHKASDSDDSDALTDDHADSSGHSSDNSNDDHSSKDNQHSGNDETAAVDEHSSSDNNANMASHVDSSLLSYEMEAIDPHSAGHITKMIEIIDSYKLEPHSDMKTLNNQLVVRNYVHFQKELSEKNEPVYLALSELFTRLEKTDINEHDQIINQLDDIRNILIKLEEVN